MKVRIARADVYTPKWRGNRQLPEAEQIRVEYKLLTAEQEERFSSISPEYDKGGDVARIKVETHANAIWDECVVKVFGLTDDAGKAIESPAKVKEIPGIYTLITEVVAQIKRGLDEPDLKNSK
jgi:hypothetical protein